MHNKSNTEDSIIHDFYIKCIEAPILYIFKSIFLNFEYISRQLVERMHCTTLKKVNHKTQTINDSIEQEIYMKYVGGPTEY